VVGLNTFGASGIIRVQFTGIAVMTASSERVLEAEQHGLGNLPLAVLAVPNQLPNWLKMQKKLSAESSRSSFQIVENSGHSVQNDQPQLVNDAVVKVLEQAKKDIVTTLIDADNGGGSP
jgi:hypothetical protein